MRDSVSLMEAFIEDSTQKRQADTLEECVDEIDELKDELGTIMHSQTPGTMRDKWDTPETKLPGMKKGRLRKDRYSALLMANAAARRLSRQLETPTYQPLGGFVHSLPQDLDDDDTLYANAPAWWHSDFDETEVYE
jgi:hypothetical protein